MTAKTWRFGDPVQVEVVGGLWRDGHVEAVSRFGGFIAVRLAGAKGDEGIVTAEVDKVRRP
jgi:hypothetical protein